MVTGLLSGSPIVLPHLITLSARYSKDCGIITPICLAVFRLIVNSNFVGCSTGISAGLAPFRIQSTITATRLIAPRSELTLRAPRAGDVAATSCCGGRQLNIFHLVRLLLAVGVGSNYTLFFERETFGRTDPQRTIVSLALWNASTVIGFGLLSLARAPCSAPSERR